MFFQKEYISIYHQECDLYAIFDKSCIDMLYIPALTD